MLRVRRAFAAPETAAAGADFVVDGGEITLSPGELERVVPIPLLSDSVNDPQETFRVHAETEQPRTRIVPGAASYTGTRRTRGCETRWTLDPGARELDGGFVGDCGGRSLSATVRMTRLGDM
jgi:hypothetical protein